MYRGFPQKMIALLRCPHDGATLAQTGNNSEASEFINAGTLRCTSCDSKYEIANGIVHFLEPELLPDLGKQERIRRDADTEDLGTEWERNAWSEMEIQPTMEASEPLQGARVLELGAGTGRHTVRMAERGSSILAVDFSPRSLEYLAVRTQPGWDLGLVCADCTKLRVAPGEFDLVASTLVSNLLTPQDRASMMRTAAEACKPTGKFVFGVHHYGIRSRVRREKQGGYYPEAPIFRYLFRRSEIEAETRQFFSEITCHPIRIAIPFAAAIGLPIIKLSRLTERVPGINLFGDLLLTVARRALPLRNQSVLSQARA